MTGIIIADDQQLFASSITMVIEKLGNGRFEVLAIAANGYELVEQIGIHRPELVLVDIRMPDMNGIDAVKVISRDFPETKVLMLTTFDFDEYIESALEYGAMGYILKDCQPEELIQACETVLNGKQYFSGEVKKRMPDENRVTGYRKVDVLEERLHSIMRVAPDLVRREVEVMDLLMKLYDNFEIADKLSVSERTVKNYTSMIYAKLGVKDRMHAVRMIRDKLEDLESGIYRE